MMVGRRVFLLGLAASPTLFCGQANAITLPSKLRAGSAVRGVTDPNATVKIGSKTYTADASGKFILPIPISGPGTIELSVSKGRGAVSKTVVGYEGRVFNRTKVIGVPRLAAEDNLPDDIERIVKPGPPQNGSGEDSLTVMRKRREAAQKQAAWKETPSISAFATKFVKPLKSWRVTSEWGSIREKHYVDGRVVEAQHMGVDLGRSDRSSQIGDSIFAPADGKVVLTGNDFFYEGNCLFLAHGGGLVTAYYHMAAPSNMKVGQMVRQGERIGQQGSTGSSTAIHLCWRAQIGGEAVDPVSLLD